MEKLIGEAEPPEERMGSGMEGSRGLTRAQGEAFREFYSVLLELDPNRRWGDMRRFITEAGDYLWICPDHHREYDPGLPTIPSE